MSSESRKKVLLMGKSGSGKTSMRSIIFANYLAKDTQRLNPTLDVQHSDVRFLGSLVLNLWDCGGQDAFYESYFDSKREDIFRNVAVLIYVIDIESANSEKDLDYYHTTCMSLSEFSPDARIFCLIHKMDLVVAHDRQRVFNEQIHIIHARSLGLPTTFFATSIYDETLYEAWGSIVHSMVPNIAILDKNLRKIAEDCGADEIVLFEKSTFLVITQCTYRMHGDRHRFEKISNIVKQFKLTCNRGQGQFSALMAGNSTFSVCIDGFTSNTYILIVNSNKNIPIESTLYNVKLVSGFFEQVISEFT